MGKKKNKQKFNQELRDAASKKAEKKQAVTGGSSKGSGKTVLIGAVVAVIAVAIVGYVVFGTGSGSGGSFEVVKAEAGMVKLPVASVNDGKAHFYTYKGNGKTINFFVLRSSDGIIRAAFDACDVCYPEKKGYRQEGDLMVCNNCGQQFPSVKINELRGGCNPAPLDRQVNGDYLEVNASDIEAGAFYF